MGAQNTSGRSPRNKGDGSAIGVVVGVIVLVVALLAGVELSRRSEPSQKSENSPKPAAGAPQATKKSSEPGRAPNRSNNPKPAHASAAAWLAELEQLLTPEPADELSAAPADAGPADPWQAWLLMRAQGPKSTEPLRAAVRALLAAPPEAPELLSGAPTFALVAALVGAKANPPTDALNETPDSAESNLKLALRVEILSQLELQRPRSQAKRLAQATERGLGQLRQSLRAALAAEESSTGALLGTLLLAQAVFRAAPLVATETQETAVRRTFARLSKLQPQLNRESAAETLLLQAAMTESIAAYVHVKRQTTDGDTRALDEKLRAGVGDLVTQLKEHASDLEGDFPSRYALTLSVRALRLAMSLLAP